MHNTFPVLRSRAPLLACINGSVYYRALARQSIDPFGCDRTRKHHGWTRQRVSLEVPRACSLVRESPLERTGALLRGAQHTSVLDCSRLRLTEPTLTWSLDACLPKVSFLLVRVNSRCCADRKCGNALNPIRRSPPYSHGYCRRRRSIHLGCILRHNHPNSKVVELHDLAIHSVIWSDKSGD